MAGVTREAAKQALCTLLLTLSGLSAGQLLLDHQDLAGLAGEHLLVLIEGDQGQGAAQRDGADTDQQRRMAVTITAYGESGIDSGAVAALHVLSSQLHSDHPAIETAFNAGVSIGNVGEVRNLTQPRHTHNEPRAALSLNAFYRLAAAATEPTSVTSVVVDIATEGGAELDQDAVITATVS